MDDLKRPDGIERRHIHEAGGEAFHIGGFVALIFLLTAGAIGVFGSVARTMVTANGIELVVHGPVRIRSGEFFEVLFTVRTEREIRDAVLRIGEDVWRDVTVNTFMPAPTEEGFKDGYFEFHFGALRPGSRLVVKVDAQVNPAYPPGNNEGAIVFADAARTLASVDYSMRIFP